MYENIYLYTFKLFQTAGSRVPSKFINQVLIILCPIDMGIFSPIVSAESVSAIVNRVMLTLNPRVDTYGFKFQNLQIKNLLI